VWLYTRTTARTPHYESFTMGGTGCIRNGRPGIITTRTPHYESVTMGGAGFVLSFALSGAARRRARRRSRGSLRRPGFDEGILSLSLPYSGLYGESL
jgi:hypothetical protein